MREKITDSYGAQIPNQLDAAYSTNLHFLLLTSLSIFSSSRQEEGIHRARALHQTRGEASKIFSSPSRSELWESHPDKPEPVKLAIESALSALGAFFLDIKLIICTKQPNWGLRAWSEPGKMEKSLAELLKNRHGPARAFASYNPSLDFGPGLRARA